MKLVKGFLKFMHGVITALILMDAISWLFFDKVPLKDLIITATIMNCYLLTYLVVFNEKPKPPTI